MSQRPAAVSSILVTLTASAALAGAWNGCAGGGERPTTSAREVLHGVEIVDPYRWLEAGGERVERWAAARDRAARSTLAQVAGRDALRAAIAAGAAHQRAMAPRRRGERYFFAVFDASAPDRVSLLVQDGRHAVPRVMVDAESLLADQGLEAERLVWPSPDGRLLAYGVKPPGERAMTLRVLDVETGRDLPDRLPGLGSGVANAVHWTPAGDALYYSAPHAAGAGIRRHRLRDAGYAGGEDALVFASPDPENVFLSADLTPDGRHLVVTAREGRASSHQLIVLAVDGARAERLDLGPVADAAWSYAGARGDEVWLHTTAEAPNGRVVALDLRRRTWRELVAESASAIDRWAPPTRVGRFVVVGYRDDSLLRIRAVDADSGAAFDLPLPKTGSIWSGFVAEPDDRELFYTLSDFTDSGTVYGFDLATRRTTVFRRPALVYDPGDYVTERLFYRNAEGRRTPIFIAHRRGLEPRRPRPAMIYGYGALSWAAAPWFRPHMAVWLDAGGIFALPAIRGGGEYGEAWRQAGLRRERRNAIADFVAAAEWLVAEGWTTPDRLAAEGQSLGGPLVAAAALERPDLFRATILAFPLIDLLRYERSPRAARWRAELGAVGDAGDFAAMLERAPLHNLDPDRCPPATLLLPGERDQTAPPYHAYKLAAALETSAPGCPRRPLLRIAWGAGHTYGASVEDAWDSYADQLAFLRSQLGTAD